VALSQGKSGVAEVDHTWIGWLRLSKEYLDAALLLHSHQKEELVLSEPTTFLYHHSAELLLKTYLMSSSVAPAKLQEIGHRTSKLVYECKLEGLYLSEATEAYLAAIPDTGGQVELRYFREGIHRRMRQDAVRSVAVSSYVIIAKQSFERSEFSMPNWQKNQLLFLERDFVNSTENLDPNGY
jgi:hypothetical protein